LRLSYRAAEERITSGIPGFDERIDNGFIRGTTTAIIGAAGTAKSTISFQFIAEGIRKNNEAGIYCTLEQPADEIRAMGKSYGYNMAELEINGLSIFVRSA
jgi:circadian clock protein KaiC